MQQEKNAILKEKEALLKEKDKKEDPLKQKDGTASKPKLSFLGKETSELTEKTKAVQDLTAKLDKKETEIKSVKAEKSKLETETKKAQDKVQDLQQKLDKATADWKKEVSDAASAYEKLQKELEPVKTKLSEQDDKVQSKTLAKKTTAMAAAANDDSKKLLADKEILTKEKQKLTEEVNKLKKEMTDVERQRKSEKEELEKNMKEKAKQVEKLQTELDSLKSQVATGLFLSRVSTVILTRDIDIAILSVRLFVCPAPVLYRNGLTYRHTFFRLWQPNHSSFLNIRHLTKLRRGHPRTEVFDTGAVYKFRHF